MSPLLSWRLRCCIGVCGWATSMQVSEEPGGVFTLEDEQILVLFASQAGQVIAKARRHRDEQRARTQPGCASTSRSMSTGPTVGGDQRRLVGRGSHHDGSSAGGPGTTKRVCDAPPPRRGSTTSSKSHTESLTGSRTRQLRSQRSSRSMTPHTDHRAQTQRSRATSTYRAAPSPAGYRWSTDPSPRVRVTTDRQQ